MAPLLLNLASRFQLDTPGKALFFLEQAAREGKHPLSKVVKHALFDVRRKEWEYREARERYKRETLHLASGLFAFLEDSVLLSELERKGLLSEEERFFLEG